MLSCQESSSCVRVLGKKARDNFKFVTIVLFLMNMRKGIRKEPAMLLGEDLTPFPSYPRAGEQALGGRSAVLLQSWVLDQKQVSCMTMASNSIVMWKLKLWLKITLLSFKLVFVGMLSQLWKLTGTHTYCVMEQSTWSVFSIWKWLRLFHIQHQFHTILKFPKVRTVLVY